jgi:hypothetical protein
VKVGFGAKDATSLTEVLSRCRDHWQGSVGGRPCVGICRFLRCRIGRHGRVLCQLSPLFEDISFLPFCSLEVLGAYLVCSSPSKSQPPPQWPSIHPIDPKSATYSAPIGFRLRQIRDLKLFRRVQCSRILPLPAPTRKSTPPFLQVVSTCILNSYLGLNLPAPITHIFKDLID